MQPISKQPIKIMRKADYSDQIKELAKNSTTITAQALKLNLKTPTILRLHTIRMLM